ncbi:MAG: hypothetical protein AAF696_22595 [Bacteroidota bacterium]
MSLLTSSPLEAQELRIAAKGHQEAHAHNDYAHKIPLWEALSHGFNSIEADTWLLEGQLYIKHFKPINLKKTPLLSGLYLEPLAKILRDKEGKLYPNIEGAFFLMIDVKNEGEASYHQLKVLLQAYTDLLEGPTPALKIFLSGNRPIELMHQDSSYHFLSLDGRPEDLGKGYSSDFMPVISQRFSKIISWKGKNPASKEDFDTLKMLADSCHAEGKKLRLWASPETELAWETLLKAGVDLINTDKLGDLEAFLNKRDK